MMHGPSVVLASLAEPASQDTAPSAASTELPPQLLLVSPGPAGLDDLGCASQLAATAHPTALTDDDKLGDIATMFEVSPHFPRVIPASPATDVEAALRDTVDADSTDYGDGSPTPVGSTSAYLDDPLPVLYPAAFRDLMAEYLWEHYKRNTDSAPYFSTPVVASAVGSEVDVTTGDEQRSRALAPMRLTAASTPQRAGHPCASAPCANR